MNKVSAALVAATLAMVLMTALETAWDTSGSVDMEQIKWPARPRSVELLAQSTPEHVQTVHTFEREPEREPPNIRPALPVFCLPDVVVGAPPAEEIRAKPPAGEIDGPDDL